MLIMCVLTLFATNEWEWVVFGYRGNNADIPTVAVLSPFQRLLTVMHSSAIASITASND